jgi:putative aldouronate transport system substrate-binding protein
MIDGYPTFTEEITNNQDGLSMAHSMARYVRSNYGGPFIQDRRYMEQYLKYPEQVDAINTWSQHQGKLILPPITATPDESQRLATIMNEVNTYVSEMFTKFIMGQEPLDNFDAFVDQMKKMNIEEAIELRQAALDRYNSR